MLLIRPLKDVGTWRGVVEPSTATFVVVDKCASNVVGIKENCFAILLSSALPSALLFTERERVGLRSIPFCYHTCVLLYLKYPD